LGSVEVGIPTLVGIATAAHFETTKISVGIVSNPLEFVFLFEEEDAAIVGGLSHAETSAQPDVSSSATDTPLLLA
jgi:hypothetical protein